MLNREWMQRLEATIIYSFSARSMLCRLPAVTAVVLLWCLATPAQTTPTPTTTPTPSINAAQINAAQITLVQSSPMIIDPPADTQEGVIMLRNNTPNPVGVLLKFGDFVNNTTKIVIPAEIGYEWPDGSAKNFGQFTMAGNTSIQVKIVISKVQGEGDAQFPLINSISGEQIGVLRITRTPFDVALDVPLVVGENTQKLDFKHGAPTSLILRNDSFARYNVRWMMVVNGVKYCGKDVPPNRWGDWFLLQSWRDWFSRLLWSGQSNLCEEWGKVDIPPNSKRRIEITPPAGWFSRAFQSIFKEDVQISDLRLRLEPYEKDGMRGTSSPLATRSLPEKEIPFTAHLSYYSPNTQLILSTIAIGFILLLGGLFSLIVRNWVPNQLRKQDFKEQLAKLAVRTGDLSSLINSNLRVLVRVEPKRLKDLLNSRIIISPDMATVFTQCEKGVKSLERRIAILETVDSTYDRIDTLWAASPPPSLIDKAEQLLFKASQLLRSNEPSELDFETAKNLVAEAGLSCDKLNASDDKFAEYLSGKIMSLKSSFAAGGSVGSTDTCARIRTLLPGPFKILEGTTDYGTPSKVASDDYTRLDISVFALTMIRDYVLLYENSSDAQLRQGLNVHEGEFIKHLSLQSREHLSKARSLLRQMREGIFTSNIKKAIDNREITIEMDPPVAREQHPVRFAARFARSELNDSAARDGFECVWDFGSARVNVDKSRFWRRSSPQTGSSLQPANGGGLYLKLPTPTKPDAATRSDPKPSVEISSQNAHTAENADHYIERGWAVSHYFVQNTTHHVSAWFEDEDGKTICENHGKLTLNRSVLPAVDPSAQSRDRLKTEIVSLAIVLVVALLGLITGAREQVLKLDIVPGLVTVFLLGFSADAIKNLLTQRSS